MAMHFIHLFDMADYQAGNYRDKSKRILRKSRIIHSLYRWKMVESMIEINCNIAVIQHISPLGPKKNFHDERHEFAINGCR